MNTMAAAAPTASISISVQIHNVSFEVASETEIGAVCIIHNDARKIKLAVEGSTYGQSSGGECVHK